MSQQGTGTINENDLMRKLVNAKKVMNVVDGGNYSKGNIDPMSLVQESNAVSTIPQTKNVTRNVASNIVNEDKIRNSKLPDTIKEAMIKNPIPTMEQISLSDGLDMNFIEGAKKLMEREGLTKKQPSQVQIQEQPVIRQQITESNTDLKSLIRETIKDTLEEIVDRKLDLILNASKTASINENLVLKVGDSIFKGKITGVNKAK